MTKRTRIGILVVFALALTGCDTRKQQSEQRENQMADDPAQTLLTSQDSGDLAVAAVTLARSGNPADHEKLGSALQSATFLERLDSLEEYRGIRQFLRIKSVTEALSQNLAPSARQLLLKLTQSKVFLDAPSRVELLIEATTPIRPAPPELIAFWDKYTDPEGATVGMVIRATLRNGSQPAIALFEKKLADNAYDDEDRADWLRVFVPPHRTNLELLHASERLIQGPLKEELRPNLVEVLFEFDRVGTGPPRRSPPPRTRSSTWPASSACARLANMRSRTSS